MRFVHDHLVLAVVVTALAGCGSDSGAGAGSMGDGGDGGSSSGGKRGKSGASNGAAGSSTGGPDGSSGSGEGGRGQGGSGAVGDGGSGTDAGPAPGAGGGSSGGSGGAGNGGAAGMGTGGGLGGGTFVTPGDPGASDVVFTIDSSGTTHPISPYVYGTNQGNFTGEAKGLTLSRVGGNRLTAYNWENNASNAGSDYMYENDTYISASKVAGDPMKKAVQSATSAGASIIMTVPTAGWVSADTSGPDDPHPASTSVIQQHFFPIIAQKGSAFAYPPDTTDSKVYADEFVAWLESQFPNAQTDPARRIFYMLDNEPDLWSFTHSEIHPDPTTYAELAQKCTDFATAIKAVAPKAIVFGPANYGWQGFANLQGAPDAGGRDFINTFLDSMKAAETKAGKRLLDVLDVHWYPEATGGGNRINDDGTGAAEVAARLQAPRSLWDPKYSETSWIVQSGSGPIQLIPRIQKQIAAHYPGTKFSISEYNYGAGGHISGGIAEADVLGIFGREGLFAATMWELSSNNTYIFGGFAMFRNYDGAGGTFGDISVSATNSAADKSSVYASVASANPMNVIVVAINKQSTAMKAGITVKHNATFNAADVYTLTSAGAKPVKAAGLTKVAVNAFSYSMPAYSVSTLVFHP
jgi:hypothetical protein